MLLSKSALIILRLGELCGESNPEEQKRKISKSMKCYREEQREGRKGKNNDV